MSSMPLPDPDVDDTAESAPITAAAPASVHPESRRAIIAGMTRATAGLADVAGVCHTLPPALAALVRRQVRAEVLALLDLLLAAPPCSVCAAQGGAGCASDTCRA